MFGLKDFSIQFLTGSPILAWVGLVGLLGLAVLMYWKTNPPLPRYIRIMMASLRVIAILALMAALFEPVISFTRQFERPQRLAVLIDRSASMAKEEQGLTRLERVDSLMASAAMSPMKALTQISIFYFGGNLTRRPDLVEDQSTALATVLQELDRQQLGQPYDRWLLFSDGRSNSGPSPQDISAVLPTPIMSIGMASGGGGTDITIASADYNAVVFVGQKTELKVKLQWDRAEGQTARVRLIDGGRTVTERRISIDQESGFADLMLDYVPDQPGQRLYRIEVAPLTDEANPDNNSKTISVKVLKNRVAILLVTPGPDYEIGFLNRFLGQSDRYDVKLISLGSHSGNLAGRFPESQTELNQYDLIILHDPDPNRLASYQDMINSFVSERGGGLWVMMGQQLARTSSSGWLNALLPFYSSHPTELLYAQFHGLPAEGQLFHPVVRLADSRAEIRDTWSGLPPFKRLVPTDQVASDGVVLAYASRVRPELDRMPILGYRRSGPGKVLASAAQPFWTWGFETLGYDGANSSYADFLEGTLNWLTVSDDYDPIRIVPENEVFSRGEPVRFEGFAFDQGFRPIPGIDGIVILTASDNDEKLEADLVSRGEGKFSAEFKDVAPGEYSYEAAFSKDNQLLKTSLGKVLVESFSLEEYDQRGDPRLLAALARATGGTYFDYKDFSEAVSSLDLKPVQESIEREIVVWGKLWLLLIFLGALATEWSWRKWKQLL